MALQSPEAVLLQSDGHEQRKEPHRTQPQRHEKSVRLDPRQTCQGEYAGNYRKNLSVIQALYPS